MNLLFDSGPSHSLSIAADIGEQAQWLHEVNPGYLLTYPTNPAALTEELQRRGIRLPALRQVRCIGETLSGELRARVREGLIVEVLDEVGRPCAPGEAGRVVVTDPHNYATPLLRYEIGDVAEVAGPCPCGRGLPTLKRILGRRRNLLVLPDGRRHWPLVGFQRFRDIAPIRQYQLIQHSLERVEVRLVADGPLHPGRKAAWPR